jgi:anaerobic magnesium-protoporphyrin IX monomethyl ester cyclase
MRVLLLNVPSRTSQARFVPLGLLYVAGIVMRERHEARIHDLYLHDMQLQRLEEIDQLIESYHPDLIAFGGIASSYGRTKRLSLHLREKYPSIPQMAGGALASVYECLLTRTAVDLVFHGETELTLPIFLHRLEDHENWKGIPGTSHRSGREIHRNPPHPQLEDLDTIPLPPYHLVNIRDYLSPTEEVVKSFIGGLSPIHQKEILKKIEEKTQLIPVITSRGCTNRCSFCYRHMRGYRQHSVSYVVRHLQYLMDTYGIRAFDFSDELFNSNRQWVLDFCDGVEALDIIYTIAGARIDRMDDGLLRRLKETGCIAIAYGQESGSDKILEEYRKGVTAEENRVLTLATREHGIMCPVQLVIGSPGETKETIGETLRFLFDVKAKDASINYLIPLPEAPIWEEAVKQIPDVERYLDEVADHGGAPLVNLTREPDRLWRSWAFMLKTEVKLAAGKNDKGYAWNLFAYPLFKALEGIYPYIPGTIITMLREVRDTSASRGGG